MRCRALVALAVLVLSSCGGKAILEVASSSASSGEGLVGGSAGFAGSPSGPDFAGAVISGGSADSGGSPNAAPIASDAGIPTDRDAGPRGVCADIGQDQCVLNTGDDTCLRDSDCKIIASPTCRGPTLLRGEYNQVGELCPLPVCPLPDPNLPVCAKCALYVAQDCAEVANPSQIAVRCIDRQCLTYLPCRGCK
jgi:hypothetical protein